MYKLYFNKKEKKILISPVKNNNLMTSKAGDEVTVYNDCYLICNNRKKLREKANELKDQWITELEEELEKTRDIKIMNKY